MNLPQCLHDGFFANERKNYVKHCSDKKNFG
jgi:hypothetical protein